jgi:polyisoprenoid-binding protein YceI
MFKFVQIVLAATSVTLFAPASMAKIKSAMNKPDIPSGAFTLDKSHATLVMAVDHLGFSSYRMTFTDWDVKLTLDVERPVRSSVIATIDANSLSLQGAPKGFREELLGKSWINAVTHPKIVFKSTHVKPTGSTAAQVTGDLTLNGVTKPVGITMRFNGGYRGHPMDPNARVGFSGEGSFKRSDFGISAGIPAPGTKMGVSDLVTFSIEAELTGPAIKQ